MAALTSVTTKAISPNAGKKCLLFETASSADSGDTVNLADSAVTGGETFSSVDWIVAWDQTTGDVVTATCSGAVVTIDAAGGTTNHVYALLVLGE